MATTTATKTVADITTDRLIIDMADEIERLDPNAGPLTLLLRKLNSAPCTQETIEWMESELEDRWDTVKTDPGSVTTTLGVNDTTNVWHKYDVGIIPLTGYKFIVSTEPASTVLSIEQLVAGSVTTVTAGQNVLKLGNALDEGGNAITPYQGTVSTVTNKVQIFEQSWQVTESVLNSSLYGGDELARLTAEKRIEHERDIEFTLFFGERVNEVADVNGAVGDVHAMGGLEYFLMNGGTTGAQITNVDGSLSESTWNTWLADLYTYQPDKPRYVFSSFYLLKALSSWAGGKLKMVPTDKTYGIAIDQYIHPFGAPCYIINNRRVLSYGEATSNVGYEGYNFGVCLDELKLRPQQGLNTRVHTNIQDPGARRRMDKINTYLSMEVRLPEVHGILYGITGIA